MFGYLFKDMALVDEYFEIQIFYSEPENAFYVVYGDVSSDDKIIVKRIDNSNECFNAISDKYLKA